jgi:hypothetical protein
VRKNYAAGNWRAELKCGGSTLLGCYLPFRTSVRGDFVRHVFTFCDP